MQFKWKRKTGQFQSGESLYINRIRVAGFEWNSSRSKGDTEAPDWVGHIELPSLNNNRMYGHGEAEVKSKIEQVVTAWFKEATNDR